MRLKLLLAHMGVMTFPRQHLRHARARFKLDGLVDCHHVIPRSLGRHPTLHRFAFNVQNSTSNYALVPNFAGKHALVLRANRVIHNNGHIKYNSFVKAQLDTIESEEEFIALLARLHKHCRHVDSNIPWD